MRDLTGSTAAERIQAYLDEFPTMVSVGGEFAHNLRFEGHTYVLGREDLEKVLAENTERQIDRDIVDAFYDAGVTDWDGYADAMDSISQPEETG